MVETSDEVCSCQRARFGEYPNKRVFLVMMEDSGTTYTCSVLAVEVEANISPSEGNNISDIGCRAKTHWI